MHSCPPPIWVYKTHSTRHHQGHWRTGAPWPASLRRTQSAFAGSSRRIYSAQSPTPQQCFPACCIFSALDVHSPRRHRLLRDNSCRRCSSASRAQPSASSTRIERHHRDYSVHSARRLAAPARALSASPRPPRPAVHRRTFRHRKEIAEKALSGIVRWR